MEGGVGGEGVLWDLGVKGKSVDYNERFLLSGSFRGLRGRAYFFGPFFFFFWSFFFFWPSRPVIYTRCRLNVSPRCGAASHFPHSLGSL